MNRFLERKEKARVGNKHGRVSEKRVIKSVGARQTPGSGALDSCKSDGVSSEFRYECKATKYRSFSIKQDILEKIRKEAAAHGQKPVLVVSFVTESGQAIRNGDYVMMRRDDFMEVCELAYGENF